MKILYRTISLIAFAIMLQQCEDSLTTETRTYYEDIGVSAASKKGAFVMKAIASPSTYPSNSFEFYLYATPGHSVTVNWGDGTSTQYFFTGNVLEKTYDAPGIYDITVSGDTRAITGFKSHSGEGPFVSANFSVLVNLESVRIGLTSGPEVLDFSANRKLTELDLTNVFELSEVVLPKKHHINTISIGGPNQMTTEQVDNVIQNIYENAVKSRIYNGSFGVAAFVFLEEGLVGPPSAPGIAMLKTLQDSYGWTITPQVE